MRGDQADGGQDAQRAADAIDMLVADLIAQSTEEQTAEGVGDEVDGHAQGGSAQREAGVGHVHGEAREHDHIHRREERGAHDQVPDGTGLERAADGVAFQLRFSARGGVGKAGGEVADGGLTDAERAHDAHDQGHDADDAQRGDDAGRLHELRADRREEGGRAPGEGHAQAGNQAALVRIPAGRNVRGDGVGKAVAEALQEAEGHIQQPGRGLRHEAAGQRAEREQDRAEQHRVFRADLRHERAADQSTGRPAQQHRRADVCNGVCGPVKVFCQRGNKHGCRVGHTGDQQDHQAADQDPKAFAVHILDCFFHRESPFYC